MSKFKFVPKGTGKPTGRKFKLVPFKAPKKTRGSRYATRSTKNA